MRALASGGRRGSARAGRRPSLRLDEEISGAAFRDGRLGRGTQRDACGGGGDDCSGRGAARGGGGRREAGRETVACVVKRDHEAVHFCGVIELKLDSFRLHQPTSVQPAKDDALLPLSLPALGCDRLGRQRRPRERRSSRNNRMRFLIHTTACLEPHNHETLPRENDRGGDERKPPELGARNALALERVELRLPDDGLFQRREVDRAPERRARKDAVRRD